MTAPDERPEPGPDAGVKDIEADIEKTRQELGETVEALQAKLDVKQQAKDKVDETKQKAADTVHNAQQVVAGKAHVAQQTVKEKPAIPVAAIAVAVVLIAGIAVWRRRR